MVTNPNGAKPSTEIVLPCLRLVKEFSGTNIFGHPDRAESIGSNLASKSSFFFRKARIDSKVKGYCMLKKITTREVNYSERQTNV